MIKQLSVSLLAFIFLSFTALTAQQLKLVGTAFFNGAVHANGDTTGTSDVWGWTAPDDTEYAIVGVETGTAFVRASDQSVRGFVDGPANNDYYYHRDIKTYRNYAYVVAELNGTNEGLQIIDMSYLPDSVHFVKSYIPTGGTDIRSHNLSIDTANAMVYILAQAYTGVRIVSIADPENPVEVGFITAQSVHDVYARNDTAWVAQGSQQKYNVWNCQNKTTPVKIGEIADPNFGYCHNIWPSDNGQIIVTTEETNFKTVKIWDASDLSNISLVGEYLADCDLAHNVQVKGDSVYISHYESGITVIDISIPQAPIEVAYYDTYNAGNSPGFYGCWGAYPYTQNGYIYATSFEGWLHVLQFDTLTSISDPVEKNAFESKVFPNPFTKSTTISFSLERGSEVRLEVRNILGELVEVLLDERLGKGIHSVEWNAEKLKSGIYFYRLEAEGKLSSGKMILTE